MKQYRQHTKSNKIARLILSSVLAFSFLMQPVCSAPQGGQVTSGSATISQVMNGTNTNTAINQASQQAIIHWQSYSTGNSEAINYAQPSSSAIALNQIAAGNPSILLGSLTANGHVWILNPSGILFGRGSAVNVGGLLASTLTMTDQNFNNGNYQLTPSATPSAVVNQTNLQGGSVALIAPLVYNGIGASVTTNSGRLTLAGSQDGFVSLDSQGLLYVSTSSGSPVTSVGLPPGSLQAGSSDLANFQSLANNKTAIPNGTTLTVNPDGSGVFGGSSGTAINAGTLTANGGVTNLLSNIDVLADNSAVFTQGSATNAANFGAGPGGDIVVQAGQNISSQSSGFSSTGLYGNISLTTPGSLVDNGSTFSQTGGGNFVSGDTIPNFESITMLAMNGPLTLNGTSVSATNGNDSLHNGIVLSTGGTIGLTNAQVKGTNVNGITLFGNSGMNLLGSTITLNTGQNANILSEGNMVINNSKFLVQNQGNLLISGDQNVTFSNSLIDQDHAGNAILFAGAGLTLQSATIDLNETNNLRVIATNNMVIDPSFGVGITPTRFNISEAADTTLSAGGTLNINPGVNLSADHDGTVRVWSGGDMTINGASFTQSFGQDLWIATTGNMTINRTNIGSDHSGNLTLLASENANLTHDDITLSNGNQSIPNDLRISADGFLTLAATTVDGDFQNTLILFGNNGVDINGSHIIHTNGGDTDILAEGPITIENGSQIEHQNSGNLTVSAEGNVTVNNSTFNVASSGNTVFYAQGILSTQNNAIFDFLNTGNESFLGDAGLTMSLTQIKNTSVGNTLIESLSPGTNVTLSQVTLQTSGGLNTRIFGQRNLTATNSSITIDHSGSLALSAGNLLTISGTTIGTTFATGPINLFGVGGVSVTGSTVSGKFVAGTPGSGVLINAPRGSISFLTSQIAAVNGPIFVGAFSGISRDLLTTFSSNGGITFSPSYWVGRNSWTIP